MNQVKYLLKFGQKQHMEAFAAGALYCSNAQTFWGIEDELKIKGQGDMLEGSSRFFGQKMAIYSYDDMNLVAEVPNCSALVRYEPAERIPVFCMFAVYEGDCVIGADDEEVICLSNEVRRTIRAHFPKADFVAIIDDPSSFLIDIENSIGTGVKHGLVQYFNIDKGLVSSDGTRVLDKQYLKYLVQDEPPVIENGKIVYRFLSKHVYRSLLCKDIFFKDEQEYRIILTDKEIDRGTSYSVNLSKKIRIMSLDDFFSNMK